MFNLKDELVQQERYRDMRRQADASRRRRELLNGHTPTSYRFAWIGDRLVEWGQRLGGRTRTTAETLSPPRTEPSEA